MDGPDVLPVDIYKGQDFYVPAFVVKVGELTNPPEIDDVLSITYSDSLTEIDSFDMTVSNWDPDTRTFKYSDGSKFNPWKPVELQLGYLGNGKNKDSLQHMLTGEITTLSPQLSSFRRTNIDYPRAEPLTPLPSPTGNSLIYRADRYRNRRIPGRQDGRANSHNVPRNGSRTRSGRHRGEQNSAKKSSSIPTWQ